MQCPFSSHVPRPTAGMRELLRLGQVRLALAHLLFSTLALCHVHNGTHELDKVAGWAENGMAYDVDVPDLPAGMNDAIIYLVVSFLTASFLRYFPDFGSIIGMKPLQECVESWGPIVRIKTQHPEAFLGPVPHLAGGG